MAEEIISAFVSMAVDTDNHDDDDDDDNEGNSSVCSDDEPADRMTRVVRRFVKCRLTQDQPIIPVLANDGYVYNRHQFIDHITRHATSPVNPVWKLKCGILVPRLSPILFECERVRGLSMTFLLALVLGEHCAAFDFIHGDGDDGRASRDFGKPSLFFLGFTVHIDPDESCSRKIDSPWRMPVILLLFWDEIVRQLVVFVYTQDENPVVLIAPINIPQPRSCRLDTITQVTAYEQSGIRIFHYGRVVFTMADHECPVDFVVDPYAFRHVWDPVSQPNALDDVRDSAFASYPNAFEKVKVVSQTCMSGCYNGYCAVPNNGYEGCALSYYGRLVDTFPAYPEHKADDAPSYRRVVICEQPNVPPLRYDFYGARLNPRLFQAGALCQSMQRGEDALPKDESELRLIQEACGTVTRQLNVSVLAHRPNHTIGDISMCQSLLNPAPCSGLGESRMFFYAEKRAPHLDLWNLFEQEDSIRMWKVWDRLFFSDGNMAITCRGHPYRFQEIGTDKVHQLRPEPSNYVMSFPVQCGFFEGTTETQLFLDGSCALDLTDRKDIHGRPFFIKSISCLQDGYFVIVTSWTVLIGVLEYRPIFK